MQEDWLGGGYDSNNEPDTNFVEQGDMESDKYLEMLNKEYGVSSFSNYTQDERIESTRLKEGDPLGLQHAGDFGLPTYDIGEVVSVVFSAAIILTAVLSVLMITKGGFSLMISSGDDDHKSAMVTIRNAIVGLFIAMIAYATLSYAGAFLGYNLTEYVSYTKVMEVIEAWSSTMQESNLR